MPATEISAGGIVYYRDEAALSILMIADRQGRWSFPKGVVGPGETPAQAALREIAEETGVPGRLEAPLGESRYYYRRAGLLVQKTVHFFLVRATATALYPQLEEVSAAQWFPAAAALAASAFPANTALLRQALARLAGDNPLNLT
jgi:8-oxo-dGTP pyrophosphatase MutT (NUDIX family)